MCFFNFFKVQLLEVIVKSNYNNNLNIMKSYINITRMLLRYMFSYYCTQNYHSYQTFIVVTVYFSKRFCWYLKAFTIIFLVLVVFYFLTIPFLYSEIIVLFNKHYFKELTGSLPSLINDYFVLNSRLIISFHNIFLLVNWL